MTVDIWIKVGTDEYKRLDLFKDETISIKDSIQDIRDIQKVFVPYTANIVVPASKLNNQVFKHYYNTDIEGFDGRFLVDSYITIDGYVYKEGKIRLEKAIVKDNEVYSYSIRFFGDTIQLSEVIGEDKLEDLDLSEYNFEYTPALVKSGFQNVDGHLTWPFISSKNYYYYSTGQNKYGVDVPDNGRSRNVYSQDPFQGVDFLDLKPAIRVQKLIDAIEAKYDITFTNHFFDVNDPKWNDLHLWLDREKGQLIGNTLTNGELEIRFDDSRIFVASSEDIRDEDNLSIINRGSGGGGGISQRWKIGFSVATDNDGVGKDFTVEVLEGLTGESLGKFNRQGKEQSDLVSSDFVEVSFEGKGLPNGDIQPIILIRSSEITLFQIPNIRFDKVFTPISVGAPIEEQVADSVNYLFNNSTLTEANYSGVVSELVPEMGILDFLTSIWKTFNLTAYKNEEGEIEVKPLGEYYSSGSTIDITEYVDTSNVEYERSILFKKIEFKNKEPKTFANKSFDNIFIGDSFGDLERTFNDKNTFTKDYTVQTNFGRIIYERMTDQYGLQETGSYQWGWAVDENKASVKTDPTLLYCHVQYVDRIVYDDGTDTQEVITRYVKPANVHESTLDSLSFGIEVDEWTHANVTSSLYNNYYKEYIEDTFDIKSRIVKISAKLPSTVLLNYKMNDTVKIEDKEYTINTLSANLSTGETQLELLTKV